MGFDAAIGSGHEDVAEKARHRLKSQPAFIDQSWAGGDAFECAKPLPVPKEWLRQRDPFGAGFAVIKPSDLSDGAAKPVFSKWHQQENAFLIV